MRKPVLTIVDHHKIYNDITHAALPENWLPGNYLYHGGSKKVIVS